MLGGGLERPEELEDQNVEVVDGGAVLVSPNLLLLKQTREISLVVRGGRCIGSCSDGSGAWCATSRGRQDRGLREQAR